MSSDTINDLKMPNAPNDARLWSHFFGEECGYEVTTLANPTVAELRAAVGKLKFETTATATVQPAAFVPTGLAPKPQGTATEDALLLFFFAGAGLQIDGQDYLVCSDTVADDVGSIWATA